MTSSQMIAKAERLRVRYAKLIEIAKAQKTNVQSFRLAIRYATDAIAEARRLERKAHQTGK